MNRPFTPRNWRDSLLDALDTMIRLVAFLVIMLATMTAAVFIWYHAFY